MVTEHENKMNQLYEHMMENRKVSFNYEQLATDIRRKKDDYSLIQDDYNGVVDISKPTTVPFRWEQEDVGKEMVIADEIGLFSPQCIVELTLTSLDDDSVEFQIDRYTLIDIGSDDAFQIIDQDVFDCGGVVRIKRSEIITGDQLGCMSDFVYGPMGAPDYKEFSLYALVQYWAHHHLLVQNLHDAAERRAQAELDKAGHIQA